MHCLGRVGQPGMVPHRPEIYAQITLIRPRKASWRGHSFHRTLVETMGTRTPPASVSPSVSLLQASVIILHMQCADSRLSGLLLLGVRLVYHSCLEEVIGKW